MKRRIYRFKTEADVDVVLTLFKNEEGTWTLTGGCNEGGKWRSHEPREIHFKDGEDAVYAVELYKWMVQDSGWTFLSQEDEDA